MISISGTNLLMELETKTQAGLYTWGTISAGTIPTIASTFAPGCEILNLSTGIKYTNTGTTASPTWTNEDSVISGDLAVSGTLTVAGLTTANGGVTLGAGDDLIGSATSDITFNTDKFTVAGATGNTVIAGTLTVSGLTVDIGSSGTPIVLTEGVPTVDLYTTSASTNGSTSVESFYAKIVMTGAAGVGGRGRFHMTTNVALGGWSNALKGHVEYGATGKTAGLGSAVLAEMALSAGTVDGTYAPLESELVLGSGASTGTETSFMYMAASGADVATMDTSGDLFKLDGLTVNSGKLFQVNTAADATHALRIDIGGTKYYIMLTDTGA